MDATDETILTLPSACARVSRSTTQRIAAFGAAATLAVGALTIASTGTVARAAGPSSLDGLASADAAASCWEIKQQHPSSADGVYWLRNADLERPEQFYCDMTTDGGGWVLIARGREGWTFRNHGQNTPQNIRNAVTGPSAFSPGALDTETIDDLLEGADVRDLPDGIRLRRALNVAGSQWQEVRWEMLDLEGWSWAVGGGHRLETFSVDGVAGTGSNTKDNLVLMDGEVGAGHRGANSEAGWFTFPWAAHGGQAGFSYHGNPQGLNNATSYLWEFANEFNAIPFTQVFLRPQITTPALAPIPDAGVPAQQQAPLLDDRPEELAGGVWGVLKVGDSEPALDTPVLAIATSGDRVYVGGKFSDVRNTVTGNLEPHAYLAAFDRNTGAWIQSFDPTLDGTVWDLKVVDNKLIVAGQFTNVDGAPLSAGLAALDLTTGAVIPTWKASLDLSGSSARPYARTLDVEGNSIYVGGNFTSVEDNAGNERSRGRLARLSVADGSSNNVFVPDLDGVAYDLDVNNGRVYIVGSFEGANGVSSRGVVTLDDTDGDVIGGLADPVWTTANPSRQYQQAVLAVGSEVWNGGSEHDTQAYSEAGLTYLKGYVTANRGGDTQDLELNDGVVYQASHANAWIYEDAFQWPNALGYTRTDDYKWVGAFDAATRQYDTTFSPSLGSAFTEGAWVLHTDSAGCTWFGGDFDGGPYVSGTRQFLEGFSKFCQRDIQAPTVPANVAAGPLNGGGMQLTWSHSTDDFPGFIGYEVLRNDRVVSALVYGNSYVDPQGALGDRYFVRAKDPAGNRSASSPVVLSGDTQNPSTPTNLAAVLLADDSVDLSWTASTDNVGVVSYEVTRNGVVILQVDDSTTAVNITGLGPGSHWLQVRAFDAAGNQSFDTPSQRVDIAGPDTQRPSVPTNLVAVVLVDDTIDVSWTASTDNVGVVSYEVTRNGVVVDLVAAPATSTNLDLGVGNHYIQVSAFDAAGNQSFDTPSTLAVVT